MNKQKDRTKESYKGKTDKLFEKIGKVLKTTMNCIEKFKSKDPLKITTGVLDIVFNLVDVGKPHDYVQFWGELAIRFESPVPFKYEYSQLTEDPDVADFVTAVVTHSEAHSCFIALLFVAKAVYADFGIAHKNERRFFTFRGKLDGGKLTKILALSKSIRGRSLVETVGHSLGLSPMHQLYCINSRVVCEISR